jgi:cytochrome P450
MADYFQQLFELRRHQPGDDLTTHLVQAEEAGDKLTNEELTANIILLFGAGHETTVNLIGNGLLALTAIPISCACCATIQIWRFNAFSKTSFAS